MMLQNTCEYKYCWHYIKFDDQSQNRQTPKLKSQPKVLHTYMVYMHTLITNLDTHGKRLKSCAYTHV